jgi:hypothetical protein
MVPGSEDGWRRMRDEDDDRDEPRIEFTDEEWAFLRYVRFGELPARVAPEERVETLETEPGGGYTDPELPRRLDNPYVG